MRRYRKRLPASPGATKRTRRRDPDVKLLRVIEPLRSVVGILQAEPTAERQLRCDLGTQPAEAMEALEKAIRLGTRHPPRPSPMSAEPEPATRLLPQCGAV